MVRTLCIASKILCSAIILGTCFLSTICFVQAQEEALLPVATAPILNEVNAANENFSLSAAVPRSREIEIIFKAIAQAIQKNDSANIADLLSEVLASRDQGFVEFQGTLHRVVPFARRLVLSLRGDNLKAYRRKSEQVAQTALGAAISECDDIPLKSVAARFPGTRTGYHALELLIANARDQGATKQATLLVQMALEQSPSSPFSKETYNRFAQLERRLASAASSPKRPLDLEPQFRPSAVPIWSVRHDLSTGSLQAIEGGHRDLRENGLTPFSSWNAQARGKNLLTITPTHLELRDRAAGALIWARALPQYSARILDKLTKSDNPLRSWNLSRAVLFRIFGESLYSHFAQDDQSIYLVEETPSGGVIDARNKKNNTAANQVVCLDAKTGKEVWTNAKISASPAYLCSPPQVFDDELLILAEFRGSPQILLLALNKKTGELLRSLPLAEAARPVESTALVKAQRIADREGRRRKFACPITIMGHKAYCPTSAGLLAVVDLLSWEVEWVYRYPRHDVLQAGRQFGRPELGLTGFQWWTTWHEVQNVVLEDRIIFASPECNLLTVLDRQGGAVIWTAQREDGIYIATADHTHGVIIIGSDFARAHSMKTGQIRWRTPLNFPAGRGVRIGNSYLVPDSDLGWVLLDLTNGEIKDSGSNIAPDIIPYDITDLRTPRNFVTLANELYELSFRGLQRLQSVTDSFSATSKMLPAQKILHLLETNQPNAAINRFLESADLFKGHIALNNLLHQAVIRQQSRNGKLSENPQLQMLMRSSDFLTSWFTNAFTQALNNNDMNQVKNLLTQYLSRPIIETFKIDRKSRTRVDRWLIATLLRANLTYTPQQKVDLAATIKQVIRERHLDQPSEQELLGNLFARSPWRITESPDDSNVAISLQKLAANSLHKLQDIARQTIFLPNEFSIEKQWSDQPPVVTQKSRFSANVYFEPIPIFNIDGTPHLDMNLEIEFPGHRGVRFSGQHWKRPWSAYLPRTERSLRMERGLVHAWACGPLIVLQVGTEVYGISPLTVEGDRGAKLLWPAKEHPIDTLGDRSNQMLSFQSKPIPERIGFPKQRAQRMNEFGHFATAVGPVRAGYFCIQQKGMLVAFETATGEEIWRRHDLPHQAICLGNEEQVVVVDRLRSSVQVLSAMDGTELSKRIQSTAQKTLLSSTGVHCLYQVDNIEQRKNRLLKGDQPVEQLHLEWMNLATGETVWEREWETAAIPFEMNGRWVGVCSLAGQIDVINMLTGENVNSHKIALPDDISKITCHTSQQNCLVFISPKMTDTKFLNATQQGNGYRRVFVGGPVINLDCQDASLLWKSEFNNAVLPLDQPVDLPIFITAGSRFPDEIMDDNSPGSRIQVFNRQSGELLYNSESLSPIARYSVTGNLETGLVTLVTKQAIITFQFKPNKK